MFTNDDYNNCIKQNCFSLLNKLHTPKYLPSRKRSAKRGELNKKEALREGKLNLSRAN